MDHDANPRYERKNLIQMAVAVVVASAIGIALALTIHWFPTQASVEGEKIDTLYDVLLVISVPIFVLVASVVLFSVWRFRMRPGEELEDGPPIHGNTRLEVVWTAIPAVLLVSLCSYAYTVLHDIEKSKPNHMTVRVTGQQFAWTFEYPNGPGGKPVRSTTLYLPEHKQIQFDVHAPDVLHDFWVPAFRMKIDAVPGITTHVKMTPKKLGSFPVVCAELCGLGHAVMRSTAVVVPQSKFDAWLAKQKPASGS
jgi:cytochrome c oxidase subunit 2